METCHSPHNSLARNSRMVSSGHKNHEIQTFLCLEGEKNQMFKQSNDYQSQSLGR